MNTNSIETEKSVLVKNSFECAIILIKDGIACDTGVCTFGDDDSVMVEVSDSEVGIYYRYGSSAMEDDDLPPIVARIGIRQFAQEVGMVAFTVNGERMDWRYNG